MTYQRKNFLKLTVTLLIFNVIIGAFAIFGVYKKESEIETYQSTYLDRVVLGVDSIPIFDRNIVMSNSTFSSAEIFPTEESVQTYLEQINSPLKNYTDQGKRASFWIYNAARGNTSSRWGVVPNINPAVILAYLQKEQSLLTLAGYDTANDPQNRIRSAMGYGCPDTSQCDSKYYGFANQVNWAAYQLQYNFGLAQNESYNDPYKVNSTISTLDEYNVFLTNAATAANYRYTPHVYWGNYNLWKIINANGWGDSNQTYNMAEIDKVNLANKDENIPLPNTDLIKKEDVENTLKKDFYLGQTSAEIRLLQQFLRQEGYYMNREITGLFGVVTQQALQNYRSENGIITELPSQDCLNLINRNWSIGVQSDEVKTLQQCLRDMGVFTFPSNTGYFGPITQNSLETAKKAISTSQDSSAEPTSKCENLREMSWSIGDKSDQVRDLQDCMTDLGYFTWKYGSTGYFGPVTEEALKKWKSASTTPDTTEEASKPDDKCLSLYDGTWKIGQTSEEVRKLQDCLTDEGYFTWKYGSTGYFGPVTESALRAYKLDNQSTNNTVPPATETPEMEKPNTEEKKDDETKNPEENTACEILKNKTWVFGQTSEEVRKLQDCMTTAGTFTWKYGSTGYFGSVTEEALKKWRAQGGLEQYCKTLKESDWQMAERSQRVKDLQDCMATAGTFTWKYGSTGYFGEVSKQALIEWRGYF